MIGLKFFSPRQLMETIYTEFILVLLSVSMHPKFYFYDKNKSWENKSFSM